LSTRCAGQLGGGPPAEGGTDEVEPVDAQLVEEPEVVLDEVGHGGHLGELVAEAETGVVGGDQVDRLRHPLVERLPVAGAARGVQEEDGPPRALAEQADLTGPHPEPGRGGSSRGNGHAQLLP
jgi:hypothetical protein